MKIKILGSGCTSCSKLYENTKKAVEEAGIDAEIIKVQEYEEMLSYGVIKTPAVVIDEKVVSSGRVLKTKEIVKFIKQNIN